MKLLLVLFSICLAAILGAVVAEDVAEMADVAQPANNVLIKQPEANSELEDDKKLAKRGYAFGFGYGHGLRGGYKGLPYYGGYSAAYVPYVSYVPVIYGGYGGFGGYGGYGGYGGGHGGWKW